MFESLEGIDWDLIEQQKVALQALSESQSQESAEAISGIVDFLDALLDDAAAAGHCGPPAEQEERDESESTAENDWNRIAPRLIYDSFAYIDLLPIEKPEPGETISAFTRRAKRTEDVLLYLLCLEADGDIDAVEYRSRLDSTIEFVEAVRDACVAHINSDTDAEVSVSTEA